jgi:hypothetical protein
VRRSWRRSQVSFAVVVLANLLALVVVWRAGWQAHALLVVYWLETGVLVAVYAVKITRAEGTDDPAEISAWTKFDGEPAEAYVGRDNRLIADTLVLEFLGMWLFAGFFFVVVGITGMLEPASPATVALAAVGLVATHAFSYRYEYLGLGEYERRGPVSLLVEPGPHFWGLMFVMVFGLGASAVSGSGAGTVVVLTFCKTCADLLAHRRARKRALSE